MELVIGAPVFNRSWVMDKWFEHLINQEIPEGLKPDDVVVLLNDGGSDDGTLKIISEWDKKLQWTIEVIDSSKSGRHQENRQWKRDRFKLMAELRNQLLERVREIGPDYYLSIDTDILAPPDMLEALIAGQWRFDGTSPTVYMTKHSTLYPNAMHLRGERAKRAIPTFAEDGYARVDVSFACVLMDPDLYAIDYVDHDQGEDIGWGFRVRDAGLTMGLHLDCKCKHVMLREQLDRHDERVGF